MVTTIFMTLINFSNLEKATFLEFSNLENAHFLEFSNLENDLKMEFSNLLLFAKSFNWLNNT